MERRTVDGVDKRHDAQRARSRASGAESNPTNTTADPVAAAGGHVGGGVKVWCGEGRVGPGCEFRVFFDGRPRFGCGNLIGAPPQDVWSRSRQVYHPLQTSGLCNGRPLRTPLILLWLLHYFGGRLAVYANMDPIRSAYAIAKPKVPSRRAR